MPRAPGPAGARRVGLRGDEPAARLGDFLGTRAVAQAQQRLLLRVHLRPRLVGLQRQRARVQHGQHGAGPHAVASSARSSCTRPLPSKASEIWRMSTLP